MATADPQSPDIIDRRLPKDDHVDQSLFKDDGKTHSLSKHDILDQNITNNQSPSKDDVVDQRLPKDDGVHKSSPEGKPVDRPPDGLPNTTARANMPGFMIETKYVMLNFMSLIPPDLYAGHIVTTPDSLTSSELSAFDLSRSNSLFSSRSHSLSKSQSVDSVLFKSHPKLKHIHKLKHFQQSIDSPASDDNTNYRYKLNSEGIDSPDGVQPDIPESDDQNAEVVNSRSLENYPASVSPRRSNLYRLASDVSSSGDFSYISDADDEYEDFSNASSIFSARSVTCRDGFLDLRRGSPRLSTVRSESESIDEPDEGHHRQSCDLQDVPEENEMSDQGTAELQTISDRCEDLIERRRPDRSKLKLEIPCQPVQLSDILVSLQTELNSEMSEMETEYEEAVRCARASLTPPPAATPLTPQTEAARTLARIGDEVKDHYEEQISAAVNRYILQNAGRMSYEAFREIAKGIVDVSLPGWRQVALLFVFGQRVVWKSIQQGNKQIECVFDYLVRLVADEAADFIIKQGGFGAVMNSDPSQSSDTFSSATDADSPPCVIDYFMDHDVTQIESKEHVDDNGTKTKPKTQPTDENSNDTLRRFGFGQAERNSLAPLADIQKDRLRSFGFDVRDLDSDSKEEQGDESLDFINYEATAGPDGGRDGNISASNSDIFIEVDNVDGSLKDLEIDVEENREEDGNGASEPDQNMISNDSELREPGESNKRLYDKDTLYVNQETPTPHESVEDSANVIAEQNLGELDESKSNPIELSDETTGQSSSVTDKQRPLRNDKNEQESTEPEVNDNQNAKHQSDNQDEAVHAEEPAMVTTEEKTESETNQTNSGRDFLGHFRSMGVKVMIATMAVLAAGVTIKVATLNR